MSPFIPQYTAGQWLLMSAAAACAGLSKAGFTGLGLVTVVVFASFFGARDSTGIVLPLFIIADIGAVSVFKQHARWDYIRRTLPLAGVGVMLGTLILSRLSNESFRPILGGVILALTVMQLIRLRAPDAFGQVPHMRAAAWGLGLLAGLTTMLANAAGPIVALYCLAVGLPKYEVVGTLAWFFFLINLFKVPFSMALGVIHGSSVTLNLLLAPAVLIGLLGGRWLITRIPQRLFDSIMLLFAATAAVRLIVGG
jgi:uncharacterized membrane protein YfcA